jgi:hypothetical protein
MNARSLGGCAAALAIAQIVLGAEVSAAETRSRTPAEIELRRAAIAARVAVLAEEEVLLQARLATVQTAIASGRPAERPAHEATQAEIAVRLEALAAERAALDDEARELAGVVTRNPTGPLTRADPQGLSPAQIGGESGQVSAGTAFNPAITVIPDGLYYYDNAQGHAAEAYGGVAGFGAPGSEVEAENVPRGFSLREVEIAFSGAVDPYFDVWATFGIGDGEIEAEEVYVQTRRFLPGTQVRFGRFLSGIGYLNRQHRHQWDFVDQALPYETLFGPNLGEVGVQVTWLPAIPVYAQFGFEALQGENGLIANQLNETYPELLDEMPGPRLFTSFVKVSPDLGFSHTLQGGVSGGRSRSHQEADASAPLPEVFDGTSWFAGTDWIWRYDSARPYGQGDLTVQGEYIYRSETLDQVNVVEPATSGSRQDGLYAQIVYGVASRWTVGGRFDAVGLRNQVEGTTGRMDLGSATRLAANVTFNPTEFSRLRVQYNVGRVPDGDGARLHQVYVQFQMSLGVHGAHTF